jgi:hypothetical protein
VLTPLSNLSDVSPTHPSILFQRSTQIVQTA